MKCRMCKGTSFKDVIDFGNAPLVNSLLKDGELYTEATYPLKVRQCQDCFLVQIADPIDSHKIYSAQDYLYYSSDMPNLAEYFAEYANDLLDRFLKPEDFVVEIGSNDGIMLNLFKGKTWGVLGVDPSTNVVVRALARGIPTISSGFDQRIAGHIRKEFKPAKAIVANNCIAHIDDLDSVVNGVKDLLTDDGVFVIECNYWGGMVKNTNYSLIYHDHFSYFTVKNWVDYLPQFGLEAFDAVVTPAQGGSLRLFMAKKGQYKATDRFKNLFQTEIETDLNSFKTTKKYNEAVFKEAKKLRELIQSLKRDGKKIAGYGAAAKGLSVLHLAGITSEIEYFVDDSPAKQDKYTPVTHIPVYARNKVSDPDYFLVTAPNYKNAIIQKEQDYIAQGGKFITVYSEII